MYNREAEGTLILSKTELERKRKLTELKHILKTIENPENNTKYIHLAGTNGKGSTSAMLASIFHHAGYKTGLFTSPHIERIYERIQVNGDPITPSDFYTLMNYTKQIYADCQLKPSVYALLTAVGFLYFQKCKCDIVILETGLGGENDPTNAISKTEAAVFTNIGLDHIPSLGTTVEEIASNKAGILKQGCDAIAYPSEAAAVRILDRACQAKNIPLRQSDFSMIVLHHSDEKGQIFDYRDRKNLYIGLLGEHQVCNAALALDTIDTMRTRGWNISEQSVREGLRLTQWPCRLEVIHHNPTVILDVVTNSLGACKFQKAINQYFPNKRPVLILGSLSYKQYLNLYDILISVADSIVAVTASGSNGCNAFQLARSLENYGKKVYACSSISDGAWLAEKLCGPEGIIAGVGTFHIMAELKEYFSGKERRDLYAAL